MNERMPRAASAVPVAVCGAEPLVVVVVAGEHQVGAEVVERLPDRLHRRVAAVAAGAEPGVVPVGQRAGSGIGREVGAEPQLLGRPGAAAADGRAVAVDRDQVPGADVEAVVPLGAIARRPALNADAVEVVEVPPRARGLILVVAGGGAGDALVQAPGRLVERVEVGESGVLVLDVAQQDHRGRRDRSHQRGRRRLLAGRRGGGAGAADHVARGDDHRVGLGGGRDDRCLAGGGGGFHPGAVGHDDQQQAEHEHERYDPDRTHTLPSLKGGSGHSTASLQNRQPPDRAPGDANPCTTVGSLRSGDPVPGGRRPCRRHSRRVVEQRPLGEILAFLDLGELMPKGVALAFERPEPGFGILRQRRLARPCGRSAGPPTARPCRAPGRP